MRDWLSLLQIPECAAFTFGLVVGLLGGMAGGVSATLATMALLK